MSDRTEFLHREPKFNMGQIVITPGAIVALEFNDLTPMDLLRRHLAGDWGDLSEDDKRLNDEALSNGDRIFSSYLLDDGQKVWIITYQNDNTCLLLPEDY